MAYTVREVKQRIEALSSMSALDPKDFCEEEGLADSLAQRFGKEALKPTQLRKVFHPLKAMRRDVERELKSEEDRKRPFQRTEVIKLMPTLAYASGRGLIPKDFYDIMRTCVSAQKIKTNDDFIRLAEFVEAILA